MPESLIHETAFRKSPRSNAPVENPVRPFQDLKSDILKAEVSDFICVVVATEKENF